MKSTVIIPTVGSSTLPKAVESVLHQSEPTACYVVVDGYQNWNAVRSLLEKYSSDEKLRIAYLHENVGRNGFYGHRIYASFTHLVNTEYLSYLDEDNWLNPGHVSTCIDTITTNDLEWCYSLRNIYKDTTFVCRDDCESLGKYQSYHGINHIDTNAYFLRRELVLNLASVWHGGWGQDRVFYSVLQNMLAKYDCTGHYTLNYRVDGNSGSVNTDFFINGNAIQTRKFNGKFPWQKTI